VSYVPLCSPRSRRGRLLPGTGGLIKLADYLAAPPKKLDDIIREVSGMELIRYTETGDAMPSVADRQRYEYDTKTAAITAAKEFYRKDLQGAAAHGQRDEKAEAGMRILEAADGSRSFANASPPVRLRALTTANPQTTASARSGGCVSLNVPDCPYFRLSHA
jgi:hypothetical protein